LIGVVKEIGLKIEEESFLKTGRHLPYGSLERIFGGRFGGGGFHGRR
jgi:hypothetical protein